MVTPGHLETRPLLDREQQTLAALQQFRSAQQRLAWLVDQARRRPALAPEFRVDAHRVQGCLVRTWFLAEFRAGRCYFKCDSDAVTLKALLGLLCDLYSGSTAPDVARAGGDFLGRLGVLHQLAENRRTTVLRVAGQIRAFAAEHTQLAAA